jgi:hypothetical protein
MTDNTDNSISPNNAKVITTYPKLNLAFLWFIMEIIFNTINYKKGIFRPKDKEIAIIESLMH